jgi:hypothetical protein
MTLSTHAIVGGAIASLMPGQPVFAFIVGVASHFAIDAIPDVDYPLYSIMARRSASSALTLNWLLVQDVGLITLARFIRQRRPKGLRAWCKALMWRRIRLRSQPHHLQPRTLRP